VADTLTKPSLVRRSSRAIKGPDDAEPAACPKHAHSETGYLGALAAGWNLEGSLAQREEFYYRRCCYLVLMHTLPS